MSVGRKVPGLTAEWSQHQLDLLELVEREAAQRPRRRQRGGYCTRCGHSHRVRDRQCARCTCSGRPEPVPLCATESSSGNGTVTAQEPACRWAHGVVEQLDARGLCPVCAADDDEGDAA